MLIIIESAAAREVQSSQAFPPVNHKKPGHQPEPNSIARPELTPAGVRLKLIPGISIDVQETVAGKVKKNIYFFPGFFGLQGFVNGCSHSMG